MLFRIERQEGFTQAEAPSLIAYLESAEAHALPLGSRVMSGTTTLAMRTGGGWWVTDAALRTKEETSV